MRVVIAGARFGGLDIANCPAGSLGDRVDVTPTKLHVTFGRTAVETIPPPCRVIAKLDISFRGERT